MDRLVSHLMLAACSQHTRRRWRKQLRIKRGWRMMRPKSFWRRSLYTLQIVKTLCSETMSTRKATCFWCKRLTRRLWRHFSCRRWVASAASARIRLGWDTEKPLIRLVSNLSATWAMQETPSWIPAHTSTLVGACRQEQNQKSIRL